MPPQIDLSNRVVAISGVASAFGRAMAGLFRSCGAQVYGCDIDAAGFAALQADGLACTAVDLRDRGAAAAWVDGVAAEAGGIDILINNAGGVAGQGHRPFEALSDTEWDVVIDINLHAAMALSRASVPHMAARGGGAIVNIASGAALRASLTGVQAYCAAKHGLLGLTRQLAHELGPRGIRVNAVAPGLVLTPATQRQWQGYAPGRQQAVLNGVALRRLGTAEEIARATLFLASDWAGFVNGQILEVNGGQ
ncbi:MAG: short-chain dehydrogenase [Alphaproteobacteria bacterium HGW-Alphaproteobacteria-16]|nr:MAG: short-chain dehydrogenase [Alphaproteobacteria bacterium HGW-Alphaproteobacteria-16]